MFYHVLTMAHLIISEKKMTGLGLVRQEFLVCFADAVNVAAVRLPTAALGSCLDHSTKLVEKTAAPILCVCTSG